MSIVLKPLVEYAKMDIHQVVESLHSSFDGLPSAEVSQRLEQYGKNIIIEEQRLKWVFRFLENFKSPLVLVLLFASITSFLIGEKIDGTIVAIIVLISGILNFFQEYHASKAAEKLQEKVATKVAVLRQNKKDEVKGAFIVPGDIVILSAGDLVPADARVLSSNDFFVNQSSLTGEPYPIEKTERANSNKNETLNDLENIVYSGSSVVTGMATVIVLKTGKYTEFGKIADKLQSNMLQSDFVKGIKNFSYLIMRITFVFVIFIFFFNTLFKHNSLFDSFTFAIAVAVGLTPELLPMIMSITMSRGSIRMAKKGVIVKRLNAIPNFGSMDILCTDKTGTLTEAHIELIKYVDVKGDHSDKVLQYAYLNSLFQTGIKNPMDEAVLAYKHLDVEVFNKIDEIPFDFERRRMSVVVEQNKKEYLITKGAPEEIFKVATYLIENNKIKPVDKKAQEEIIKVYHSLSEDGFRVLAIAIKEVKNIKGYSKKDEEEMELIGFIAFLDPPRKDVKEALLELEKMGVGIKVVTGDNELVTKKICQEVGLEVKGVLLGSHVDTLQDDALRVVAEKTTIFARFTPEQKNRVIRALKSSNHVVGYMGDGINDAPSLKASDVGISVDTAVDVAKEAADMILTHKSLHELKDGVLEGRKTFSNTMKYIMMGISANFGNMFSVLGAVLFLPFLPMLPIQILLNNLLYDFSQITIPTDSVDSEYIQKPTRWDISFIKKFMFTFGPISSLFDFLTFFVLYSFFKSLPGTFQTGWFLESLTTQILVIYIIRTKRLPFIQSVPSKALLINTLLVIAFAWIFPFTPVGRLFGFVHLSLPILLSIIWIVFMYLVVVELVKNIFYHLQHS